jgi:hypothetical protein
MFRDKIKVGTHAVINVMTVDARRLYLDTSNIAFMNTEMDETNSHITAISFENKVILRQGDKIQMKLGTVNTVYEVAYMVIEKKGKSVVVYSALPTKTELFLLPAIGKTQKQLKFNTYFVNAQLDYSHEFLCLTYRFTGTETYKEFENYMVTDPLCTFHLEHGKYQVTYMFKIPLKFNADVLSFVEGRYSKFSKALIDRIRRFHGTESSKPMLEIIRKDKDLKANMERYLGMELPATSELASKPDIKTEIYQPYDRSK